ncbi:MAG: Ribose-phosphate pyrophosphokinase [Candidatus Pacebacteria bacterium GW2011_GWA1_46_10]|nr:MAG: Ribose-phosphate pyrophosphokinase [Candidatus Pacebacteria bacterium GW2011_GWA1_46_10]HCR81638.1 hypothetical protein [Candidatus Paceibacterota bacterium]
MPNSDQESKLHIPRSFRDYRPLFSAKLQAEFPQLRFDIHAFSNGMPLFLSGEVPHAVMIAILNGDNFKETIADLFAASTLTQDSSDAAGKNVDRLTVFTPFADFRQDHRERKLISPDSKYDMAVVKAQASTTKALAAMMRYVAGVDNVVTLDGHSHLATTHFQEVGIEVINTTAAFAAVNELMARGYLNDKQRIVVTGVDFGNLAVVDAVSKRFGFDRAIIRKWRQMLEGGTKTITRQELVEGKLKGATVLILDDMAASGGTLGNSADLAIGKGAKEVILFATHRVYAGTTYYAQLQRLLDRDRVKVVMTSNSLPLERRGWEGDKSDPKVRRPDSSGEMATKGVELLNLDEFTIDTLRSLLASGGNPERMRELLKENVIKQEDPYVIYQRLTGKRAKKPRDRAIYDQGEYRALPGAEPLPAGINDNGRGGEY